MKYLILIMMNYWEPYGKIQLKKMGAGEGFCLACNLGVTLIQLILLSFWEKLSISNITQYWENKKPHDKYM
jgi:hypothetical protein